MLNVGRLAAVMILAKKAASASKRASGWLVGLFFILVLIKVGPVLAVGLLAAVMILAKRRSVQRAVPVLPHLHRAQSLH